MSDTEKPGAFGGGWVGVGYFDAMGIPVREGRTFSDGDMKGTGATILVNDTMAKRYWPGESAVGKRVRLRATGPWMTIAGVVGTVRSAHADEVGIQIYYPLSDASMFPDTSLLVATVGDPDGKRPGHGECAWSP